jgi:hypothetical protein
MADGIYVTILTIAQTALRRVLDIIGAHGLTEEETNLVRSVVDLCHQVIEKYQENGA